MDEIFKVSSALIGQFVWTDKERHCMGIKIRYPAQTKTTESFKNIQKNFITALKQEKNHT